MSDLELELRADVDTLKIEIEALRRTLSGLVDHFDDRLRLERTRVIHEFDPEQSPVQPNQGVRPAA